MRAGAVAGVSRLKKAGYTLKEIISGGFVSLSELKKAFDATQLLPYSSAEEFLKEFTIRELVAAAMLDLDKYPEQLDYVRKAHKGAFGGFAYKYGGLELKAMGLKVSWICQAHESGKSAQHIFGWQATQCKYCGTLKQASPFALVCVMNRTLLLTTLLMESCRMALASLGEGKDGTPLCANCSGGLGPAVSQRVHSHVDVRSQ